GHGLEEIPAERIEEVDLAAVSGLEHLQRAMPLTARQRAAPQGLEATAVGFAGDLEASGILVGVDAALAAPLNTGVPADRHDPALLATEESARQREIDQGLHVVDAEAMLGETHAVDEDGAARAADFLGKASHVFAGQPAVGFE